MGRPGKGESGAKSKHLDFKGQGERNSKGNIVKKIGGVWWLLETHRRTYAAKHITVTVNIDRGGADNDNATVEFEAKGSDTIAGKLSELHGTLDVCRDSRYEFSIQDGSGNGNWMI